MATENNNEGKKKSWSYFLKMVGLNLFIVVALGTLAILGLSMWLDSYTRHNERIEVPSLAGVPVGDALQFLENKGLKGMVIDSVYADVRPGSVVEQMPAAGLPVKEGRIVYLTINAIGVRMVKMKDVREGGSRQALSDLHTLGFIVDSIRQVPSENDDLVLSVTTHGEEMEPGQMYPVGTHVVVHVGRSNMEITPENEETEEAWME